MDIAAANTAAARALVAGLAAAGVTDCAISPGSRSTPLTVAFAEQKAVRPWLHLDERSGAYFALGLARATGRPVGLLLHYLLGMAGAPATRRKTAAARRARAD